jgi:hypothetical protein
MMHIKTGGGFHDYALDLQKCSLDPKQLMISPRRLNRNFVIEVLKANGAALRYLDKSFAKDRDLVLIGVQKISKRLDLQNHRRFYSDREVMLHAIQSCGDCMKLVGPLKADRAFVLEAVRLQPDAYHLAAEELKRDEEIIRTALTGNRFIESKLPSDIRRSPWVKELCSSIYDKEYADYQEKLLIETASYEQERAAEESKRLMDETEELVHALLTDLDPEFGINE